jgi:hypothetical protein
MAGKLCTVPPWIYIDGMEHFGVYPDHTIDPPRGLHKLASKNSGAYSVLRLWSMFLNVAQRPHPAAAAEIRGLRAISSCKRKRLSHGAETILVCRIVRPYSVTALPVSEPLHERLWNFLIVRLS